MISPELHDDVGRAYLHRVLVGALPAGMTVLAPLLSGFALIAASALLPEAALSSLRSSTTVGRVGGGSSAAPPRMAVEPSTGQGGGWRARLRTGSTAVAAAALLAVPRGPAQAAEIGSDGAAGISRDVGSFKCGSRRRRLEPAFLGFARKKSGLDMPLDRSELRGNQIDLDAIVSPKMAKRFTERGFIFSDSLTYKGELAEELDELDAIKEDKKGAVLVSTLTTTGGAVGLVYLSVKGLQGIEDYFKRQVPPPAASPPPPRRRRFAAATSPPSPCRRRLAAAATSLPPLPYRPRHHPLAAPDPLFPRTLAPYRSSRRLRRSAS